ncbi:hypothetical protein EIP91_000258 [Steccherinum ochraceum]|uniref:C2H2-type domain-containing protein n=1 Tax=Steccherinum ochraceum TaxID=92696 RepID=A0A4V2MWS1_9APHY|nr:hypothetical protein EIP91_000258 [Steccherinum ochraceum]
MDTPRARSARHHSESSRREDTYYHPYRTPSSRASSSSRLSTPPEDRELYESPRRHEDDDGASKRRVSSVHLGTRATYSWARSDNDMPRIYIKRYESQPKPHIPLPIYSESTFASPYSVASSLPSPTRSTSAMSAHSEGSQSPHSYSRSNTPPLAFTLSPASFQSRMPSLSPEPQPHMPQPLDSSDVRPEASVATSGPQLNAQDAALSAAWKKHVREDKQMDMFTCLWPVEDDNGRMTTCNYHSRKHLVKRHMRAVHLKFRNIVCKECGKGFAQRTALRTHMNVHTGDTPHKCTYPGCEKRFGDPAKRHRHMVKVHKHISSRRRTQTDQEGDGDANMSEEN